MKQVEKLLESIRAKRINRCFAVRADDEDWVTIKGTHVLVGENGEALSGGKLKGTKLTRAKSTKTSTKAQQVAPTKIINGLKIGKNSIKTPIGHFQRFGNYNVVVNGEIWKHLPGQGAFVRESDNEIMTDDEYREKYGDEVEIKPFKNDNPDYLDFVNELKKHADTNGGFDVLTNKAYLKLTKTNLEEAEKKYNEDPTDYNKRVLERWEEAVKRQEEKLAIVETRENERAEYYKAVMQAYEATGQSVFRPDTFVGFKRGAEMSHKEADSGSVNPHYDPGSIEYTSNCQTCVVAYEARLRGYDVHAGAFRTNSPLYDLARESNTAWLDPATGAAPKRIVPNSDSDLPDGNACKNWIADNMEEGARYTVRMTWKGSRSGHIICCHKENGKVVLYDPQDNETFDNDEAVSKFLDRAEPLSMGLVRVDDKIMNPFVMEGCFAKE